MPTSFFHNGPVHVALAVGGMVAVVSGIVGTLTVIRGQSFAGHALADVGSAGGAAAFLVGVNPLFGFLVMDLLGAAAIDVVGIRRARGRDVATGVVLGAALGLASLFLYLDASSTSASGAAISVLFGSIFTLPGSLVLPVAVLSVLALGVVAVLYRPLMLSSVSEDLARAKGVRLRLIGMCYLAALACAVSLSAITIGAILSTALLIGPAATAVQLTRRAGAAMVLAAGTGLGATWLGVLLAYDSYYWSASHSAWPVSFFVVALVVVIFLAAHLLARARGLSA